MEYKIALLPGDGIGPEIIAEATKTLDRVAAKYGHRFEYRRALVGAAAIDATGDPYPDETHRVCCESDAVLFGAIGDPKYDNDPTSKVRPEQGLLRMRKSLGLFANLRPVSLFDALADRFRLDPKRSIHAFSKGMKKQVSILLGLCAGTKYLLCDETFDGLDPVVRQAVKSLIAAEITERDFTPVISSHNLRELEDICDSIGLLHEGRLLLTRDLDDAKNNICKLQCVIPDSRREQELISSLRILKMERTGSLLTMTVRGERTEALQRAQAQEPLFVEALPLTLEEIFISETEVAGYDIKDFLR